MHSPHQAKPICLSRSVIDALPFLQSRRESRDFALLLLGVLSDEQLPRLPRQCDLLHTCIRYIATHLAFPQAKATIVIGSIVPAECILTISCSMQSTRRHRGRYRTAVLVTSLRSLTSKATQTPFYYMIIEPFLLYRERACKAHHDYD